MTAGAPPVGLVGRPDCRLAPSAPRSVRWTQAGRALAPQASMVGQLLWPSEEGSVEAIRDGNRAAVVCLGPWVHGGRSWWLSLKGVGARAPMFGQEPWDGALASEAWMGEAPYGAQGEANVMVAQALTERAPWGEWNGVRWCPTLCAVELPSGWAEEAGRRHWYRRHRGPMFQEQRLVPSNLRLFHQSERTLGQDPAQVLAGLGVERGDLDAFVDTYIRSGVALLTLFPRTRVDTPDGPRGLDYRDVWLDKDSLLAPDGALVFADLEGLEWVGPTADRSLEALVRAQVDRSAYEWFYGLDVLLRQVERWQGRPQVGAVGRRARRAEALRRVEVALVGDPFVGTERRGRRGAEGLDLVVTLGNGAAVRVPWIDLEEDA